MFQVPRSFLIKSFYIIIALINSIIGSMLIPFLYLAKMIQRIKREEIHKEFVIF